MNKWLHKYKLLAATLGLSYAGTAYTMDYDLGLKYGFYSFLSQTSTDSSNISFPGYFGFEFNASVTDYIVISPGYSMYILTGDGIELGYGFDIALKYFPLTPSSVKISKTGNTEWMSAPIWRPYLTAGFEQRQFQSIQSNYAGLMLGAGTHYQMFNEDYIYGEFSYTYLAGPSVSSINEIRLSLGYGFSIL